MSTDPLQVTAVRDRRRRVPPALPLVLLAAVWAGDAAAQDPPPPPPPGTSHEGHARVRSPATVVRRDGSRVRFAVGCPARTSTECQGTARLVTADAVPVRRGGPRRVVTIATARFGGLRPGEAATVTVAVRREARYALRRACVVRATGIADNTLAGGDVRTTSPVRVRRC